VTSGFVLAWRPLAQYADFSGRSRRSDLLFFYVLTGTLNLLVNWAGLAIGLEHYRWITLAFSLALLCPWAALAVRRLHDTGRSGWWLLLALPSFALNTWAFIRLEREGVLFVIANPIPNALILAAQSCLLALIVLLLWKDEEAANIYGPNPRYDAAEAAA
jgi:uncharacterized membrane protein YhaH (DUF805 family)